jgi:hypothetical protein
MLDGSSHGAITLADGSTYTAAVGVLSLVGQLNLGTSTGSTLNVMGQFQVSGGDATFSGPGVVTMSENGSIGGDGTLRTLTNKATIQGSGLIGDNTGVLSSNINLDNEGTVSANVAAQTLMVENTGYLVNHGTLKAENGGILEIGQSYVAGSGTIDAQTGSTVLFDHPTMVVGNVEGTGYLEGGVTVHGSFTFGDDDTAGSLTSIGNTTSDGTVIELGDGVGLTHDESFTLIDYSGDETGGFSNITGADAQDWIVNYHDSQGSDPFVVLTYDGPNIKPPPQGVPEPSAWMDWVFLVVVAAAGSRAFQRPPSPVRLRR